MLELNFSVLVRSVVLNLFVHVPPDIISLQFRTPEVVGIHIIKAINSLYLHVKSYIQKYIK
jgi:hypothetical protein